MTILLQRMSEGEEATTSNSGFGAVESQYGNLPLRQLNYHAAMLGLAVRTTILQTYYNPFDEAIEATYIFPLEYGQAVIACEMRIGERVVQAELKERAEARREYAQAIRQGHRAALLEENRPETFSMCVGNIPPGEAIQICIQTVSQLSVVQGEWTLRLPLVVAPRYTSGLPLPRPACGGGIASDTYHVPDASTVTPPTWLPGFASPIDLRLVVDMDFGQMPCDANWVQQLKSSLHTALVDSQVGDSGAECPNRCRVQMLPGERVNRDFILRGKVLDLQTSSSVVCETVDIAKADGSGSTPLTTFAVTVVPPRAMSVGPRQLFYLLDRSGSMEGWKITAARRGLCRLIDRLSPQDDFQLATFDSCLDVYQTTAKRGAWIAGTDANRFEAVRWLSNVEARGGTELGKALEFALQAFSTNLHAVKIHNAAIVLVTDGQVTGEDELLRLIDKLPRNQVPRLFCLGVDRAVNASVLERISRRTGGTFELIESEERLNEVLERFATEIANPALTQMTISCQSGESINIAQPTTNTLYAGRSQTIYGCYAGTNPLTLNVHGLTADFARYHEQLVVPTSPTISQAKSASPGLLRALWGKERLRKLEDDLFASGERDKKLKQEIIDCSRECGVLSRLTAFVAIDKTEKVTNGRRPHSILNPSELPEGWAVPSRLDTSLLMRVPRAGSASLATPYPALAATAELAAQKMLDAGAISSAQLTEARQFATARGMDVCGALIELHYATHTSVARGIAAATQTTYISLDQLKIDERILLQLPESVARENHVLPIADGASALSVVMSNPQDLETIEKLRFILNRNIIAFCSAHDEIAQSINDHYGQIEGESVDSMLQEFTDSQIDFSQSDYNVYSSGFDSDTYFGFAAPGTPAPRDGGTLGKLRKLIPRGGQASRRAPISAGRVDGSDKSKLGPSIRLTPEVLQADENNAPIVRLVGLLLAEAIKMRATYIIARMEAAAIHIEFVIDGQLVQRDQVPVRLWWSILNHVKLLAKLDIARRDGVQSGTIKVTVGEAEQDMVVTTALKSFMIELSAAKQLPAVPEAIEKWHAAYGATAQP